jgi:hypothetical protein
VKCRHSPRIYDPRVRDIETIDSELRLVAALRRAGVGRTHAVDRRGGCASGAAIRCDSIVLCVGFLTRILRLGAILASSLLVLVSGVAVSLGEIVGQRFCGRLMFLSEQLMHKGYLILAPGFRTVGFRGLVVGFVGAVVGSLGALGGSLNVDGGDTTPGRRIGASGSGFVRSSCGAVVGGP